MTATQKARALLAQYHAATATYESPDPHDREERRYDNMNAARSRVEDVALVEALLAEREWQPIETAPEGEWVMTWTARGRGPKGVTIGHVGPLTRAQCTHWQPLPAPPIGTSDRDQRPDSADAEEVAK